MFSSPVLTSQRNRSHLNGRDPCTKLAALRKITGEPLKRKPPVKVAPIQRKVQTKLEQETYERKEALRSQIQNLSDAQTQRYRYSHYHTMCLDILQEGLHHTYEEIHFLTQNQRSRRARSEELGGGSNESAEASLLEAQVERLETLRKELSIAERSSDDMEILYKRQQVLAEFFASKADEHDDSSLTDDNDRFVANHFYNRCLETAQDLKLQFPDPDPHIDRYMAEASMLNGKVHERSKQWRSALAHYERYYALSMENKEWENFEGRAFWRDACTLISRIYGELANALHATPADALRPKEETDDEHKHLLIKCYEFANQAGVQEDLAAACYSLGVFYQKSSKFDQAVKFLRDYLSICERSGDSAGTAIAYQELANLAESKGNIDESVSYLQRYVKISEKEASENAQQQQPGTGPPTVDPDSVSHRLAAFAHLGRLHNNLGNYADAREHLQHAFSSSLQLDGQIYQRPAPRDQPTTPASHEDSRSTNTAAGSYRSKTRAYRSQLATCSAHSLLTAFVLHVEANERDCVSRLMTWKDRRERAKIEEEAEVMMNPPNDRAALSSVGDGEEGGGVRSSQVVEELATANNKEGGGGN